MKSFAYVTFCLILILGSADHAVAQVQGTSSTSIKGASAEKRFSAEWRLRLTGEDYHDEQSQSKIFDIRADLKAKYTLNSSLYLDLQPSLRLQSGQTQSVDGADKAENRISLTQAALVYKPFSVTRMSVGALSQRYMHAQLLVDDLAFPAARAEAILTRGTVLTILAIESAIPTSSSLSTNTRELEPTPSLNTASLKMNIQASKDLYLKMTGGYFIFNNLPSAVAHQSRLLGNEIDVISDAQYAFTHKFEGLEAFSEFSIPLSTWMDLFGGAEYLVNQKAPADLGTGYFYELGSEFHLTSGLDMQVRAAYFSIAPEAAVAYFNGRRFETNRVGYAVQNMYLFKKEGFKVGAQYKEAEVMFTNSIQSKDQSIMLLLETFYADI